MNIVGKLLEEHNMSQKELALTLGIAQPSVSAWVNQKADPKGQNAKRIAEIFGVDRDSIVVDQPTYSYPFSPVPHSPSSGLTDEDLAKIAEMVHKKHPSIGEAVPQTIEARILAAGVDKMPEADRERALQAMRFLFIDYADYFETKGTKNDDT